MTATEAKPLKLPWRRPDYAQRTCLKCGCDFQALPSRIAQVFRLHVERCERATDEERRQFVRTRRWGRT